MSRPSDSGAVVLLLSLAFCAYGQGHASLFGRVQDSTGGVVANARLILWNQDTGQSRVVKTDHTGWYLFSHLQPGRYGISISSPGFRKVSRSDIRLHISDRVALDVILHVAPVEETITVAASEGGTRSTGGTLRGTVDQRRIEYLPLNRREVTQLITAQPGVTARDQSATEGSGYAVNGSRQSSVHYTLDGGANTDSYRHLSGVFPNASAIEEVNIERSTLSAEYGNSSGAVVSVVTKSGTNTVHGSAFGFLRNGALNARDFFAARRDNLKRSQFGGTLGGPVVRNRLFYFGSYQGTRTRSDPLLTSQYLPTAQMRAGDFSGLNRSLTDPLTNLPFAGNQIPASRLSPVTQALLRYIPVPDSPSGQRLVGIQDRTAEDEYIGRLDLQTDYHRFTGRYFRRNLHRPFSGDPLDLASMYDPSVSRSLQPYSHLTVSDTWLLSAKRINVLTFAVRQRRTLNDWSGVDLPIDFASAGVKGIAVKQPASLFVNVSGNFLARPGWNYDKRDADIHIANTHTWMTGRHELKIGGEYLRVRNDIRNEFRTMGNFEFNGSATRHPMSDFLLGEVYQFWQGGGEYKDLTGHRGGLFIQEYWRARPDFTLDIGLRWEPFIPYQDKLGRTQCFVPGAHSTRFVNAPSGYLNAGDRGCPQGGFHSYWKSFAPRFGFAWRPFRGATTVRGGAGIFWHPQFTMLYNGFVNSAPFSPQVTLYGVSFSDPYGDVPNPFPQSFAPFQPSSDVLFSKPLGQFGAFASTFRPAYSENLNLTVERRIAGNWTGRMSYIGNLGRRLSYTHDVNYGRYTDGATLANLQQRRPYQDFAGILITESGSTSSYHALEISAARQSGNGLSLEANYTWSKVIDEYSEDSRPGQTASIAIPFNRRAARAVADFDIRHQLVASAVWWVPSPAQRGWWSHAAGGWALAGIAVVRSGLPFSVRSGTDQAMSGVGQDFADITGTPRLPSDRPKGERIAEYFNTSAFALAAPGTFGNAPRNLLRAPGLANLDLAVIKRVISRDRLQTQLRGEFYNTLNNVNLGAPFSLVSNPARFGRIETSAPARVVQFALVTLF